MQLSGPPDFGFDAYQIALFDYVITRPPTDTGLATKYTVGFSVGHGEERAVFTQATGTVFGENLREINALCCHISRSKHPKIIGG